MIQTDIFDYLYPSYKIPKPIRLFELFAGVGTQAMALRDLGADFECWKTCEWDYHAVLTYAAIHCGNDKTNYSCSLSNYDLTNTLWHYGISTDGKERMDLAGIKRMAEHKKRKIYNAIMASHNLVNITSVSATDLNITDKDNYCYIMTYSFPCQDLSRAGKQKGMEKGSGTRSGLLWEVERLLLELKERNSLPQVLIMENVPDVIGKANYENFIAWYSSLESMGYQSYYKLLNAKDYGAPQSRNRCFMVSIFGEYNYTFENSIPLEKCLRDVLEDEVDEKYYFANDKVQRLLDKGNIKTENEIANTVRSSGRSRLDRHTWDVIQIGNLIESNSRDNPQSGRIYSTNGLSPTLCCMEGGNRQPFILQRSRGYNKGGLHNVCPTITTGAFKENNFVLDPVCMNSKIDGKQPSLQDRIYDTNAISTAITTSFMPSIAESAQLEKPRIRKLTPLECWRLMDYSDEDFRKAQAVNSNTRLYKQAGNGIVKAVMMAVIRPLLGKEK